MNLQHGITETVDTLNLITTHHHKYRSPTRQPPNRKDLLQGACKIGLRLGLFVVFWYSKDPKEYDYKPL